ncbi:carbohydrate porin [Acinetobacter sp. S40]|uniref:carbohydrate porin n=1 Tax=unclassified Acinetobacter TaxID=196816 RepID=UPI00190AB9F2|nr:MULTISPECIES: carbohydrate porin [unclassified Acinetobacter]MBJ9985951.1 carbohydrate porin [Acinetobacter sp. S40]MBK0064455.1 carbohydrate porin [Acinetobacter sp. S55]MBK0067153.1 carbohydrate porin [Acinetobacter sp. S54]
MKIQGLKQFSIASIVIALSSFNLSHADDAFSPQSKYLFGDWNGKRTELASQGANFDANLYVDTDYLADGGYKPRDGATFASQLWLGSSLDLEKLLGWSGVSVRAIVTARQGQSTSAENISYPGAPQMANTQATWGRGNVDSRLTQLSIEKIFADTGWSVRVGRMGMGSYFNVMGCDFQSTSFCTAQNGKWMGNVWYNEPVAQWAGIVKYRFTPELSAQVGAFEFNPTNIKENQGWNLKSEEAEGVTVPVELHYQPKQGINQLPGSYRLGVFYNNADKTQNKDVLTGEQKDRAYAGWLTVDQQLSSIDGSKRGLYGFSNISFHDKTVNKIDNTQQIGIRYLGLLDEHPNDILGLGVNRIHVNDRYRKGIYNKGAINEDAEYNIELNYSHYVTPWLMLRPVVQYVIQPGATDKVDNALVLGLTTKVIF